VVVLVAIGFLALAGGSDMLAGPVRKQVVYWGSGIFAAALAVALLGARFPERYSSNSRLGRFLAGGLRTITALVRRSRLVCTALLLSAVYQTAMILSHYGVARGLGLQVGLDAFFVLIPLTALVTMLPVSMNGYGLREGAFAFAFSQIGLPVEAAVAISVAATLCTMALSLVGGVLYATGPVSTGHRVPEDPGLLKTGELA
jgi:hypothetical protein